MDDKRETPRRKSYLVGKIVYGNETYTMDCTIRDLSETGAKVKVLDPFSVPNNAIFLDPKKFVAYESTVKWRKGTEMGLSFDREISLEDKANPRIQILRRVSLEARAK